MARAVLWNWKKWLHVYILVKWPLTFGGHLLTFCVKNLWIWTFSRCDTWASKFATINVQVSHLEKFYIVYKRVIFEVVIFWQNKHVHRCSTITYWKILVFRYRILKNIGLQVSHFGTRVLIVLRVSHIEKYVHSGITYWKFFPSTITLWKCSLFEHVMTYKYTNIPDAVYVLKTIFRFLERYS